MIRACVQRVRDHASAQNEAKLLSVDKLIRFGRGPAAPLKRSCRVSAP